MREFDPHPVRQFFLEMIYVKILIYGDSNTWGQVPDVNGYSKDAIIKRYPLTKIWWYELSKSREVIVNGLSGRAINNDNPWLDGRNAMKTLKNDLEDVNNIDLLIIQLGTNDCKSRYNLTEDEITLQMRQLIHELKKILDCEVILLSPALIKEGNRITDKFYRGGEDKSRKLTASYSKLADELNIGFVSALECQIGEDGEHLTEEGHKMLSKKVLSFINKRYNKNSKR